jgi:hypothetical protein
MVERKEICVNDMTSCINEQLAAKKKEVANFRKKINIIFIFYDEVTNKTTAAGLPVRSTYAHVSLQCFLRLLSRSQSCGCGDMREIY